MTSIARAALIAALAFAPAAAFAQGTTMTGPGGRSATAQSTRDGGNTTQSVTGPRGQTASRSVTRDPTTGTATATTTGPRGQGTSRTTTR